MHYVDDGRKFFNGKGEKTVPVELARMRNLPNPVNSNHELVCVAFIEGHHLAKRTVSNLLPGSETHETKVNRRILVIPQVFKTCSLYYQG